MLHTPTHVSRKFPGSFPGIRLVHGRTTKISPKRGFFATLAASRAVRASTAEDVEDRPLFNPDSLFFTPPERPQ
jgi:hypothetical protein